MCFRRKGIYYRELQQSLVEKWLLVASPIACGGRALHSRLRQVRSIAVVWAIGFPTPSNLKRLRWRLLNQLLPVRVIRKEEIRLLAFIGEQIQIHNQIHTEGASPRILIGDINGEGVLSLSTPQKILE